MELRWIVFLFFSTISHEIYYRTAQSVQQPAAGIYQILMDKIIKIEWNNRTIKKRVKEIFHRLPYEYLQRIMVKYMVVESTKKLNLFPN